MADPTPLLPASAWSPDAGPVLWWWGEPDGRVVCMPSAITAPTPAEGQGQRLPPIPLHAWWQPLGTVMPTRQAHRAVRAYRLRSVANTTPKWQERARHRREDHARARELLAGYTAPEHAHIFIHLARHAPRLLDSHDNLRMAFKGIVDGITEALGFAADDDDRLVWSYGQDRTARGHVVELVIREQAPW